MVTIAKKQVKALVDSGACETIIAMSWVKYLGLKNMINYADRMPEGLKAATGEYMKVVGSIWLNVTVGRKDSAVEGMGGEESGGAVDCG